MTTNGSAVFPLTIPSGAKNLRVMLYWTDPQASTAASQALVNDLDLEVSNNQGTTLLPWVLDATPNATTLNNNATRGVDRLNNVEQVTIQSPGTSYSVTVKGFNVPTGSQKYYVTYEYDMENLSIEYPHVNAKLTPEIQRFDGIVTLVILFNGHIALTQCPLGTPYPCPMPQILE